MNLILTGSSTGIGRALADRLLSSGHSVWGLARSDQSDFAARWPNAFRSSRCDMADWGQVEKTATEVASAWTHADGLVTCAGLQGEIGRTVTADPLKWDATVRANLEGTFHAIRAFHGLLERAPRRAKIICFSGGGAAKPRPRFSAYAASKAGVVRLVETIAEEEQGRPLDINAVAPGAILTRLTDEVLSAGPAIAGEADYRTALKTKSEGTAALERAIDLVEWLLSPASDGISGRLISARWDPWGSFDPAKLAGTDLYTLRRITEEKPGRQARPAQNP